MHKPTLLHREAWAGVGLGMLIASAAFYYMQQSSLAVTVEIGIIGLALFLLAVRRRGYHHRRHVF